MTVVLVEPAEAGTHEVRLEYALSGETVISTLRYNVEPERLEKIELGGSETLPRMDGVEVPVQFLNQYDEPMSILPEDVTLLTTAGDGELHPDRDAVLLDLADQASGTSLTVMVIHQPTGKRGDRQYQVGEQPVIESLEAGGFVDETGEAITHLQRGETAYLVLRVYDQYGNLISDLPWLNERLRAEHSVANRIGSTSAKSLVRGPGGVVAVQITGDASLMDTTQTVIIRSSSGSELLRADITLRGYLVMPALELPTPQPPSPTVAIDPDSVFTVKEAVYSPDLRTYVTVTSTRANQLHYALMPEDVPDAPTRDQLLSGDSLPAGIHHYGQTATSGTVQLALPTEEGKYRLYVIASSGTRVSRMAMWEIDARRDDAIALISVIDMTDEADADWTIGLIHSPADVTGTVYYLVTDNPLHPSPEDVVEYATGVKDPDGAPVTILKYGHKDWSGMHDAIVIAGREAHTWHIYVVLEHRGILLLQEDMLSDH